MSRRGGRIPAAIEIALPPFAGGAAEYGLPWNARS